MQLRIDLTDLGARLDGDVLEIEVPSISGSMFRDDFVRFLRDEVGSLECDRILDDVHDLASRKVLIAKLSERIL